MTFRALAGTLVLAIVVTVGGIAVAIDSPDSAINPVNGDIEIADPIWSGLNQDINYVIISKEESRRSTETVTADPSDDKDPYLALSPGGDAWVTWWRDDAVVDLVLVRKRHYTDGSWDDERVLSTPGKSSSNPRIVHDGSDPWVAYEVDEPGCTDIAVGIVVDEPDPIVVPTIVATTHYTQLRDVRIHSEEGHLWVTWVDSSTDVGYVEYDYSQGTWTLPAFESYAPSTTSDARAMIRAAIVSD